MKNAGVYLRVSTQEQNELNQEPPCVEVCRQRGWTPVIYREVESGMKTRPVWDQLMEDVRTARLGAVVVFSVNRIGRRRVQIASDLAKLARYGASVVSVCEKFIDLDGSPEMAPIRDLLVQWWGWFAERKRDEISVRTRSAMAAVRENIRRHGAHITANGRAIVRLGAPGFPAEWRERAIALYLAGETSFTAITRIITAEGGPKISRYAVRLWVLAHQATAPKDAPAHQAAAAASTDRRAEA